MLELLLDGASLAVRAAPAHRRYLLADAVTSLVPVVAPGLFRRTQANFARAFHAQGAQGAHRAARLARASIHNFGRMATDFLWIRTLAPREVESFTTLSGDTHLWEVLRAGRGVILVLPHMGCWDVAAARASAAGLPITIVTEDTWAARLVSFSRQRPGVALVSRDRSLRALVSALRRNEAVVLLSDLARPGVQTVEVPFFEYPAPLPSGPARLSARTGAPIVAVACVRTAECHYRVDIRPPIWPDGGVARDGHVHALTRRIAADFQVLITQYPDQWYPFGRVWTLPD